MDQPGESVEKSKVRGQRAGPLRRFAATDAMAIRELLALAGQTLEPEDRTQRQLFSALMPDLYVLRKRGFSFPQLTKLLNDSGFNLQVGTVRSYYSEMIAERMSECEQRFDEQMLVLKEVQGMARSSEVPKLATRILEIRQQSQVLAEQKANKVLSATVPAQSKRIEHEPAKPAGRGAGDLDDTSPAAPQEKDPEPSQGSFGLLSIGSGSTVEVKPGGGFFSMDEPQVPIVPGNASSRQNDSIPPPAAVTNSSAHLRCMDLQQGIEPLKERPNVPPEVYSEGLMEHPAIPGLMLTLQQRLYGAMLELVDSEGEIRLETLDEKRYRIKWQRKLAPTDTASRANFVKTHPDALPQGNK